MRHSGLKGAVFDELNSAFNKVFEPKVKTFYPRVDGHPSAEQATTQQMDEQAPTIVPASPPPTSPRTRLATPKTVMVKQNDGSFVSLKLAKQPRQPTRVNSPAPPAKSPKPKPAEKKILPPTSLTTVHRADVYIINHANSNKQTLIDVKVVKPCVADSPGVAAQRASEEKVVLYTRNYQVSRRDICGFVIETGGCWSKAAVDFVLQACRAMVEFKDGDEIDIKRLSKNFFHRASVAVQRGNASMVIAYMGEHIDASSRITSA